MKCNVVKDTSLCVYLDDYIVNQLNYIYWQSSIYFCYVFTEMIYLGYYFRGSDIIIMYRNVKLYIMIEWLKTDQTIQFQIDKTKVKRSVNYKSKFSYT